MMRDQILVRRRLMALLVGGLVLGACSVSTTTESNERSGFDARTTDLLHERGAAARAIAEIEAQVGAAPARVGEILIYPQFLDVEAQDPEIPEHIDEYGWRDGSVSGPDPVHLSGPQEDVEASLFPTTAVRWSEIPRIVSEVEARARRARPTPIEDAIASYLIAERSTSTEDDGRVELTVYINGPRRSGYAELTATGDIVTLTVS